MTTPATQPQWEAVVLECVRDVVAEVRAPDRAAKVALDSSFERDLGLGSLELVEVLTRLEVSLGVSLPATTLTVIDTPGDLVDAVRRASRYQPRRAAPRRLPPAPPPPGGAPDRAETLVEVLEWHVRAHPGRPHLRLVGEGGPERPLTYGQLGDRAAQVAAGLLDAGLSPGERVAMMLPTGEEYFPVFFGVLQAGGVPVPIYPPARRSQIEDHLRRHVRILDNAQASFLVVTPEARPLARLVRSQVASLRRVVTPSDMAASPATAPTTGPPAGRATDPALLQYTSGSTGNPKGVVLTHANLLANIRAMGAAAGVSSSDVFVSWLPLYHDMGLIGAWLTSLYFGMTLAVMSPLAFLTRPSRWLWALHDHRGTLSAAPNFAYELCLRKVADAELVGLDLSSWRMALNGAEPVSPQTIERFADRFASYGLRREALMPVYGLAEASVGLAFPPPGRGPLIDRIVRDPFLRSGRAVPAGVDEPDPLRFAACGVPLPGHEIRVVDPAGEELGERREGRIEFRGPSATSGYFRNPEATRDLFHRGWLDTGDLGYVAGGELFVTGRVKDMIIRAGRNLHPEELEEAVGELDGIRKGCVAVFPTVDRAAGTERLVVLAETREQAADRREELSHGIVSVSVDLLGSPPDEVVLAPPGTVLKTSSGKIRRAASRDLYERGLVGRRPASARWQLARFAWTGRLPATRRWARTAMAMAYAAYGWLLLAVVGLPTLALMALLPRATWRWRAARRAVHLLLRLSGTRLSVGGAEHLSSLGRAVVVANHPSFLDGFVLVAALPGAHAFVAGEVFARQRVSGFLLRRLGAEFVERGDREQAVADARRLVDRAGQASLVFFPEGGLSRVPGLRPFHLGAFVTAATAGLPVVPVAIRGTRSMLRAGHRFLRPGAIHVEIGSPIVASGSGWTAAAELQRAARARILAACGEPDLG